MKALLFPLTLLGVVALSSCVNPALTASPNRYGYEGTVTGGGTAPIPPVDPGATVAVSDPGPVSTASVDDPAPIDLDTTPTPPRNPVTTPDPDPEPAPPSNVAGNNEKPAEPEPKLEIPYAIPVPGKEGLVYSPHNKDAGHADVRGMRPGVIVEDPYAPGKYFRVP
ncbi:hypothetical protein [Sulfuriroseicoccus oceanibius]|uniref:Uncharacterized protein n=1 Tax=Sulfuriroseicoccus oceanibius TaxID=2707525 RepID=A0A6B3L1R5_9BACT|nr:hypothetical protein [Sulfuriroseicoccus oceanibius]QQL46232.1 hypothetical protein G3M56_006520 [Sulfuriroseicoccus oceanibius]